ncbi:PREDICTED: UDP-glucuronic acid decarboxylase 1-like [Priapulus caudatus]|uniref:UDP-glucuronic acid decarboxylase 1-like n=1 Tax=Priapulus caudatus TaxID=37621 RepID=A0ABM1E416_PRICU|nr:PREDICTED: UDP-glucuronic acid decarboxylase 1-like [Priapulus caudatus]
MSRNNFVCSKKIKMLAFIVTVFVVGSYVYGHAFKGDIVPGNRADMQQQQSPLVHPASQESSRTHNKFVPSDFGAQQCEKKMKDLEERLSNIEQERKTYPETKYLTYKDKKRILVTGGAGFVGSHLVDALMMRGHEVTVVDNFFTGRKRNIVHWIGHENFELLHHDIVNPLYIEVDEIYHLASPASPPHYMFNPVKTLKTNTLGTINILGLAKRVRARVLFASTSEVYGDPEEHPQSEDYWGHVNPIGPRACYDEGKRVAETLCYSYMKQDNIDVRVARIFNTYGPRMHMNDGRVVSNFILQSLQNEALTIYGSGEQTRSFQYVSDLVDGLMALMRSNYTLPVNLGNPEEHTINEFAHIIKKIIGQCSITNHSAVWSGYVVPMLDGLNWTIAYFRDELQHAKRKENFHVWEPRSASNYKMHGQQNQQWLPHL